MPIFANFFFSSIHTLIFENEKIIFCETTFVIRQEIFVVEFHMFEDLFEYTSLECFNREQIIVFVCL